LALEKHRNLIEINITAGITLYKDHKPGLYENSLSNKGQLSGWRLLETADLLSIVENLYRTGQNVVSLRMRILAAGGLIFRMGIIIEVHQVPFIFAVHFCLFRFAVHFAFLGDFSLRRLSLSELQRSVARYSGPNNP
jgi:hypothetical protein